MKRFYSVLCAVCAMFSSCQKENAVPAAVKTVEMSFSAVCEDTKASLGSRSGSRTNISWAEGDEISVFDGVANNRFVTESSGESVSFRGMAAEGKESYYALYPYNSSASLNGSSIGAVVPIYQSCVPDTFDPNAGLAVSVTDGEEFSFKQATALLKFTIPAGCTKVGYINFMAFGGVGICGNTSINPSSGNASSGDASLVQMTRWWNQQGGEGYIAPGTYYISIIPGTLSSGFIMEIHSTSGSVVTKSSSNSFTFQRGKIYNLGTIPTSFDTYSPGSPLTSKSFNTSAEYLIMNLRYGTYLRFASSGVSPVLVSGEAATVAADPSCRFKFTGSGDNSRITTVDGAYKLAFDWKGSGTRYSTVVYFQPSGDEMDYEYSSGNTAFRIRSNQGSPSYYYRNFRATSSNGVDGWVQTTITNPGKEYFWQIIPVTITHTEL